MKRLILIAVAAAGLGTVALAQPPGRPGGPGGPGGPGPRLKEELGLSEAQETQIRKLHLDQRKAQIRRRADLEVARLELHDLLAADTVDEKAVQAKVQQIADLEAANLRARVDTQLAMRKVLTPEQQKKFKELHQRRPRGPRGEGPRMHGPMRGGPGGPGGPELEEPGDEPDPDEPPPLTPEETR